MLFGLAIFCGSFLLFQIQPILGKYILPWFGGTPAVWTTCILFFQAFLLVGYGYAFALTKLFSIRAQTIVHCVLLIVALAALPIIPSASWRPEAGSNPSMTILALLTISVGLPYTLLAATGPLLQRWFHLRSMGASPYRLYALSNLGSMLALLSYPVLLETTLSRHTQAIVWSWSMAGFSILCGLVAISLRKVREPGLTTATELPVDVPAPIHTKMLWLLLPAVASVVLLATTNKLSQDVVAVPFLWIGPLALYLLSFIIAFDRSKWYARPVFGIMFSMGLAGICWLTLSKSEPSLSVTIAIYVWTLFSACMICHGELYRLRPDPRHLTSFYLLVAGGGAIGGAIVTLLAPVVFDDYYEFQIGLIVCAALYLYLLFADRSSALYRGKPVIAWGFIVAAFLTLIVILQNGIATSREHTVATSRNFYGTLAVAEYSKEKPKFLHRTLRHGKTLHGLQYLSQQLQYYPTTYYTEHSGMGLGILSFPRQERRRIGVVGLGVGTIATWGKPGDYLRLYEINPGVKEIAEKYFTYMRNCRASYEYVIADGRLAMESEPPQQFDILILDAFNNDAPPVHLLTREAFETYRRHLAPDGIIAVNITCRYLNLLPVLSRMANQSEMHRAYIPDPNREDEFRRSESSWVLLSSDPGILSHPLIVKAMYEPPQSYENFPLWTDDYTALVPILKW